MKNFFAVLALSIFIHAASFADGFTSVHSPNGQDVWAVGVNGNVFHSVDGGATWASLPQGTITFRSVFSLGSTIWMVGDQGVCYSSTNNGANFVQESPAGTTNLSQILFLNAQTGFIAGANGLILKTTNAGATWGTLTTGTTARINMLSFVDMQTGFAAGANGTLLKTVNGGTTWTSVGGSGWTSDILSVHAVGTAVYVTGTEGFTQKSLDGGATWTSLYFQTDSKVDVNDVFVRDATNAFFVGGGGFIRSTTDGGGAYTWARHQMYAKLNDIYFYDNLRGWVCSEKNNAVMRTTDGGTTWLLPTGTTINYQWQNKFNGNSIGNTFMINPWNRNHLYVVMGSTVWMSGNRGETWSQTATISTGGSTWSFYISPRDTNIWIAATSGGGKGVRRSTNRGQTWTTTLLRNFTSYGMPLEMDPDHPDTVIFAAEGTGSGPDGILYISRNFGATWDTLSRTQFRSPCDLVIVPGNTNIWYCGDGTTGSGNGRMWLSQDYGTSWNSIYSVSGSEIPMIATSRHRNTEAFATAWGSGGFWKTSDIGRTWSAIASTGSTWGVDVAKDDPNVVLYGVYGGATSYLSRDAGTTFQATPLSGSNSGILCYDRSTFLAHQASGGVWKYNITYVVPTNNSAAISLSAPNGGENWQYGTTRNIQWTSTNISNIRIEYRTSPSSAWQTVVASTPASTGSYAWAIPNAPSTQARVRITDLGTGTIADSSDANFSITVAAIAAQPTSINFGTVPVGQSRVEILTLTNNGSAPLVVSSVTASNASFIAGRTSFTIGTGQSDTLSVRFTPTTNQTYNEQLSIVCNAPTSPLIVPLTGGTSTIAVLAPNGGEVWNVGSTQNIRWNAVGLTSIEISYKTSPTSTWIRIAQSVDASQGTYAWTVPNTPSTQARVRILDRLTGSVVDSSDNVFTIQGTNSVAERRAGIPTTIELEQNYPNPFNPSTVINYGVPHESIVTLRVYNMIGQEVATLINERQAAGRYTITFDAAQLKGTISSGLYFYRLTAGELVQIRKMTLVK
jgi:photosystem II stability/assembly factor-like uncharacterized protein